MQVLLNSDVSKLGYRGDIVNVKNGYFRNFLWPQGLAKVATKKEIELSEARNEKRVMQKKQVVENAQDVLGKLKGLSVTITGKASDKGHLYGSVTEMEVVAAIKEATNVELGPEFIKMDHFKEVGEHKALVHLGEGLEQEVSVVVEAV